MIRLVNAPSKRLVGGVIRRINNILREINSLTLVYRCRSTHEGQTRQLDGSRNQGDADGFRTLHRIQRDVLRQIRQTSIQSTCFAACSFISHGHSAAGAVALVIYVKQRSVRSFDSPNDVVRQVLCSIVDGNGFLFILLYLAEYYVSHLQLTLN